MNRKYFISSLIAAGIILPSIQSDVVAKGVLRSSRVRIPPYLVKGDTIGITSPAGYISREAVQPAVDLLKSWGFNVLTGTAIGKRAYTLGGTDQERAADFQDMIDNDDVKAIMCARGGYGTIRIIDQLNFEKFRKDSKWIIGFSDITVFHSHLNRVYNVASIHSKMCNSFPSDLAQADAIQTETIESIKTALTGEKMYYTSPASSYNRNGRGRGALVGGNLSILENLAGSKSDLITKGKILFVEDTGEYLYNIDRMFYNLKRGGKLDELAGLIVGGFRIKAEEPGEEFGKTIGEIVMEKIKDYNYPVCFDFPVGHQKNNFALRAGADHLLWVNNLGAVLQS